MCEVKCRTDPSTAGTSTSTVSGAAVRRCLGTATVLVGVWRRPVAAERVRVVGGMVSSSKDELSRARAGLTSPCPGGESRGLIGDVEQRVRAVHVVQVPQHTQEGLTVLLVVHGDLVGGQH